MGFHRCFNLNTPTDLTIVLHKTACGQNCTATDIANSFKNDTIDHKSVHFIVGRDGSVIQVVLLKDGAAVTVVWKMGMTPIGIDYRQHTET